MARTVGSNGVGEAMPYISLEEVSKHCQREDQWLIIDNNVYNITNWAKQHPGGARILNHFAGQDATDAWYAMHKDKKYVTKFMKSLFLGKIKPIESKEGSVTQDIHKMRMEAENLGLFKVSPGFFIGHFAHLIMLEVFAYWLLQSYGPGWMSYLIVAVLLTTSQAQAGWTQHDYGHLSVFAGSRWNHWLHYIVIGHLKGASSHWWNFRHFQHHVKPNALDKDPDVNTAHVFLLGDKLPVQWGKRKKGVLPYQWQHDYFWLVGPPTLLPIYFHLENLYFVFKRKDWVDLFWMSTFFIRYFYLYGPILGGWGAFGLYMFVRFLESHWFTMVTQMNHIPMEIDLDRKRDWLTSQLTSTCNVESTVFNDWFTGHLNFQIEHHLFPTMPRHNYHRVAPLVRSLCEKHALPYVVKPLGTAFVDIARSLKKSGRLWYDAYHDI